MIRNRKLNLGRINAKVTYHDPCFLSRWNGIYNEPRKILRSIPGLIFVEMLRSRKDTFCCGGGSGNFYTDYLGGKDSPAKTRVKDAAKVADVLVTACPVCLMMLDDAAKEESIEVKDVAEILLESLNA